MLPMMRFTLVLAILAVPTLAAAQGTVDVRLRDSAGRPVDGTVTLRGPATASCRTVASRCTVNVPPGIYTATLRPVREQAPRGQRITVQDRRTVVLAMQTQAETQTVRTQQTRTVQTRTTPVRTTTTQPTRTTRVTTPNTRVRTTQQTRSVSQTRQVRTQTTRPAVRVPTQQNTVQSRTVRTTRPVQTTTTRSVRTTQSQTAQTRVAARDLSRGNRVSVRGNVRDASGRPADATLTVRQGAQVVGTVRTVAGRFTCYDLPPGTYEVSARSARSGSTTTSRWRVGNGVAQPVVRVN